VAYYAYCHRCCQPPPIDVVQLGFDGLYVNLLVYVIEDCRAYGKEKKVFYYVDQFFHIPIFLSYKYI